MNTSKFTLWLMAGAFIFMCAALLGLTVGANGNLVEAQSDNHQKVTSSSGETTQPKMVCPMEWTSPISSSNAGEMPATGSISFDWSDHPSASDYDLTVLTPNGSPVSYEVDGSSKELFLENYSQVGNYQVFLTALDANGNPLCSITMGFSMPTVANTGEHVKKESEGGEPSSVIPSNPVVEPTPTEVEIH